MLTIGEFSRLTRIPAKTLRYYDEIDLFKPAQVDAVNSYRYYNLAQLPRLYRILALKGLDLSLEQIKNVLDEELSLDELRGMLRLKRAELQQMVADIQQQLDDVELKLQQLNQQGRLLSQYAVLVKDVPPMKIALARDVVPSKAHLKDTLFRLFVSIREFLSQNRIQPAGSGMTLYFDEEYRETDMEVGAAMPIDAEIVSNAEISVEMLPGHLMVSTVHYGDLAKMENAYVAILAWLENSPYQIVGLSREIALHYIPGGNPAEFVTEIQFPVIRQPS